jgi:hypothetical protein
VSVSPRTLLGTESELVVALEKPSVDGELSLAPAGRDVHRTLLDLAYQLFGYRRTELGRVQLLDGAVMYIDGTSLEYATPPCTSSADVALYESDLQTLVSYLIEAYEEQSHQRVHILQPGHGPGGVECGYHENYGLLHEDYFRLFAAANFQPMAIWPRVLVPFLVARIVVTGVGGYADGRSVISPRAHAVTHVFHHSSTLPYRPMIRTRRPDLRDQHLRVEICCADASRSLFPIEFRLGTTRLLLSAAAAGAFDRIDLTLLDPVSSMRQLATDPFALLERLDGKRTSAFYILRALYEQVAEALPHLEDHAQSDGAELLDAFEVWGRIE